MTIRTNNDQASIYANFLSFLTSCQIISKHIGIGHQESVIIDYTAQTPKIPECVLPVKAGRK